MSFKLFHWRTRVKTATPEVAGSSVETLTSHVSDINAHPDYLKKGAAVPTGQEQIVLRKHEISPLAHSKNYIRRSEVLKTLAQFKAAQSADINDNPNNYDAASPQRHIVSAYVLGLVLNDIFDHGKLVIGPIGDGTQLIYVNDTSDIVVSHANIGNESQFVYLKDGVVTAATGSVGSSIRPVYIEDGTFKSSSSSVGDSSTPIYMENGEIKTCNKAAFQIPVGGCFTTIYYKDDDGTEFTADDIASLLGYGTWSNLLIIGSKEAKTWQRIA